MKYAYNFNLMQKSFLGYKLFSKDLALHGGMRKFLCRWIG
ncbi:hypothetical protein Cabys_2173 [Caldithrix abyssi DSM 13497]|uniref:Uncharacterized protein n=1 Tax=Caldithrix abyssi DSM 13497 TaxID=880073 RepID=A0A1J1CAA6_CALAY|nr:hypothetical protein Cabys_2173 [Caldithrix abyssi DSM 13497]